MLDQQFPEIISLIKQSRHYALKAVNVALIDLYWNVGEYISNNIKNKNWGDSVVEQLALYIVQNDPSLKGFSTKNLWRMKQFYETYVDFPILSSLLRELSWTHNLTIFSRCKSTEEQKFYLQHCKIENYSVRELDRQISASLYERKMLNKPVLSKMLGELYNTDNQIFKDNYVFEFLNLPDGYSEKDLQNALIVELKNFMLEMGKDFLFVAKNYRLQVGNQDFYIDLLFFHRSLQCLVAFELKSDRFNPEHLGQLNFYLEALDRDVKNPNENPSIGILLCKDKDTEVVEYALNRSLSPTMVADYKMKLPDKKLLQQKLHELLR